MKELIRKVLQNVVHVSFKKFYSELKKQIEVNEQIDLLLEEQDGIFE